MQQGAYEGHDPYRHRKQRVAPTQGSPPAWSRQPQMEAGEQSWYHLTSDTPLPLALRIATDIRSAPSARPPDCH
eukprot:349882-Chlamydomonas_euryale.AAC.1